MTYSTEIVEVSSLLPNINPPDLLRLPTELVELVLLTLHPLEIVRCRRLCRLLLRIIDASIELQIRMELAIDGYLLNYRDPRESASDVLRRVRYHHRAQEDFNPRLVFELNVPFFRRYDLADGVYGQVADIDDEDGSIVSQLLYHELRPTTQSAKRHVEWRYPTEFEICDISFNMKDDIQVLTELPSRPENSAVDGNANATTRTRIYFHAISTNQPHPSAKHPFIEVKEPLLDENWDSSYTILQNDILGILFAQDGGLASVVARNWKTGEEILPFSIALDVAFVSDRYLAVLRDGPEQEPERGISIEMFLLSERRFIAAFRFQSGTKYNRAHFIPDRTCCSERHSHLSEQAEFVPDPAVDILGLKLMVEKEGQDSNSRPAFTMVIFLAPILQLCDKSASYRSQTPQVFEWEDWGTQSTRWFSHTFFETGFLSIYGARMLTYEIRAPSPRQLVMLDFNPRIISKDNALSTRDRTGASLHLPIVPSSGQEESVDDCDTMSFGGLAFRELTSSHDLTYDDIDLDGTSLIARREDAIHVFALLPGSEAEETM